MIIVIQAMSNDFKSAILAGIAIGIAGFCYLSSKNIIGAVLFSFGLLTVVSYQLKLFTGTAGFFNKNEVGKLFIILFGNLVGTFLASIMLRFSPDNLVTVATTITNSRISAGLISIFILAIGCGFIMTTAVNFARKQNYLPLIFGVPVFITCGFPHCIADSFYIFSSELNFLLANIYMIISLWICAVIGNFIGCNIYRLTTWVR